MDDDNSQVNNSVVNDDDHAYLFGPMLVPAYRLVDGSWGVEAPVVPPMAIQQAILHQPVGQYQQQVTQQPAFQKPAVMPAAQPAVQQPAVQQPAIHQVAINQPGPANLLCPVQDCTWSRPRLDHLWDHLAETHGYDRAAREYSVDEQHLERKNVGALKALFIRDARKLAWSKARLLAAEEAIIQADPSYVSCHGFGLAMEHSIPEVNACRKKKILVAKLVAVRNEMSQKGRLYNQPGQAQSSWEEVYNNLISTFHLNQNVVDQRAEQCFYHLRVAMGDNMADNVTPAQVELTHQLPLKAGGSLPPK